MSYLCRACGKPKAGKSHPKCSRIIQARMAEENERRRQERIMRWDQERSTPIEHWKGK